ncbi:MAG TPA: hypothetical protein VLJ68_13550 [Chitinophagaceae bacterium]|nr:hypothetical protein [Chitinophagaceae bacterium]
MTRRLLFISVFIASSLISFSQHCPWDGTSMIMLDVKIPQNVSVEKISLLDSSHSIVIRKIYYSDSIHAEEAIFWKNPPPGTVKGSWTREGYHFSFAKDYQIVEFGGRENPPYRVLIRYKIGNEIMEKEIPLPADAIHGLCTLNTELWGGKVKPVTITL